MDPAKLLLVWLTKPQALAFISRGPHPEAHEGSGVAPGAKWMRLASSFSVSYLIPLAQYHLFILSNFMQPLCLGGDVLLQTEKIPHGAQGKCMLRF